MVHGIPGIFTGPDWTAFSITDSRDSDVAMLLLEWDTYSPDANIPAWMPRGRDGRLRIVADILLKMYHSFGAEQMTVLVADCNQCDGIVRTAPASFAECLLQDCRRECPPCLLYTIQHR